ncbi:hypothetical protein Taro_032446 [Colocasia esculenta]|uniref:Uncharacterized protein n=1 Tax=Colocasia esculenta TaxID=4460 RepID=A0A843W1Y2_COLES|nr:hypothetical protein [Colocasia esculenta]
MGPQLSQAAVTPDRWFGNPFLGAVRGGTGVCSSLTSWLVRDTGWFCLWALDLVEVFPTLLLSRVVASAFVGVPTALAGMDSLSQEFVAGRWWSSDLWVVAQPSGSLAGVREVASFQAGSGCELQKSVAAIAGCAYYERGCWFARAAVEFVVGLRVRVGVSRRLREPTCGVAFTGAGLWSAEPLVERCDTYLWLLSALCWLVVNSGEVLPEFFSVGSSGSEVEVHRLDALCSGDVFPDRLAIVLVRLALRTAPGLTVPWWFWWRFSQNRFVLLPLATIGLLRGFFLCFPWLLGVVVLVNGNWCHVAQCGDLHGEGPSPCAVLRATCLVFSVRQHWFSSVWLACAGIVRSGALCCVLLRADVVIVLMKLLVFIMLLWWVSGGESLLFGLELFQVVGAVVYCTLSVFLSLLRVLCLEGLLWGVCPVSYVVSAGCATMLHVTEFGACGSTMCSCSTSCVVSRVCSVFEALSFPPLEHFVLARALWLPLWVGCFALSSFGLGPFEVDVLSSTSAIVSFLVRFFDILGCLAMPNSGVIPYHEDDLDEIEWCRWTLSCMLWHSLCGRVVVMTTGKSCVASEVPNATVICVATSGSVAFLSCPVNGETLSGRSVQGHRVKVDNMTHRPVASWGRRLKAFLSFTLPFSSPRGKGGSLFHLRAWSVVAPAAAHAELGAASWSEEEVFLLSRRPYVVCVATLGCSILAVCLPFDVATTVRVVTSEEASPWVHVTVALPVAMVSQRVRRVQQHLACLRWFRGLGWHVGVCPKAGLPLGPSGRAVCAGIGRRSSWGGFRETWSPFPGTPILESLLREFSGLQACSMSLVALSLHGGCSLSMSSVVGLVVVASCIMFSGFRCVFSQAALCRHPTVSSVTCSLVPSVVAPECVLFLSDLVEVWDVGGCVLRCCFRIVFDSTGSAGVVFSPTLFLLLWLVRDWLSLLSLVREVHPLLSSGRDSLS